MPDLNYGIVFVFIIAGVFTITMWVVLAWAAARWAEKRGVDKWNMFALAIFMSPIWVWMYVKWIK